MKNFNLFIVLFSVVKILRILSGHSKTAAEDLTRKFSLETLIKMYLSLNHKDFKGKIKNFTKFVEVYVRYILLL